MGFCRSQKNFFFFFSFFVRHNVLSEYFLMDGPEGMIMRNCQRKYNVSSFTDKASLLGYHTHVEMLWVMFTLYHIITFGTKLILQIVQLLNNI